MRSARVLGVASAVFLAGYFARHFFEPHLWELRIAYAEGVGTLLWIGYELIKARLERWKWKMREQWQAEIDEARLHDRTREELWKLRKRVYRSKVARMMETEARSKERTRR